MPDAWVSIPSADQMAERGMRGDQGPYGFGFVPGMARLIVAHDQIGPAFGALFAQVMFAPGHLERREREMVAAVAAAAQDCFY